MTQIYVSKSQCMHSILRGAKWPISTNFGNNWVRNTVSEIIREVPLFVVLELGELEYPLVFIHVALTISIWNLKN